MHTCFSNKRKEVTNDIGYNIYAKSKLKEYENLYDSVD